MTSDKTNPKLKIVQDTRPDHWIKQPEVESFQTIGLLSWNVLLEVRRKMLEDKSS